MARLAVVLAAVAVVAGIAWGAQLQRECYDPPSPEPGAELVLCGGTTIGNAVPLTGLVVAGAVAALAATTSDVPQRGPATLLDVVRRRALPGSAVAAGAYGLVLLCQGMYANVDRIGVVSESAGVLEEYMANLSVSLILGPGPAIPALFAPILLLAWACGASLAWGWRRLHGRPAGDPGQRLVAASLTCAPILAVLAGGCLRLLADLPQAAGTGAFLILLPLTLLALLVLAGAPLYRLAHWQRFQRDPRWRPVAREAFAVAQRAETGAALALVGVALLANFVPDVPASLLENGRTFGASLPNHAQLTVLAALPAAVAWRENRATHRRLLEGEPAVPANVEFRSSAWLLAGAVGASMVLATLVSFIPTDALTALLVVAAPCAAVALAHARATAGAGALAFGAFVLWAKGNAVVAHYQFSQRAELVFEAGPGALAVWRLAASVLLGIALVRLVAVHRSQVQAVARLGVAILVGIAANLELPLAAWTDQTAIGQSIRVGSLLSSQSGAVQAVFHVVALLCAALAALLLEARPQKARPAAREASAKATAS